MLQFKKSTNERAVANQGGEMEAETISKNGASSGSLMYRGIFKIKQTFFMIFFAANAFILISCEKVPETPSNVWTYPSGDREYSATSDVNIHWNTSQGAKSYNVYRSNSSSGILTLIGSSDNSSYTDYAPLIGNNYYAVTSVNGAGESGHSVFPNSEAHVNFTAVARPSYPANVTATQSGSSIIVSWSAVTGATSYRIYRSNTSSNTFTNVVGTSTSTTYTDNQPLTGSNVYCIAAVNSAGESNGCRWASINYTPGGGGITYKTYNTAYIYYLGNLSGKSQFKLSLYNSGNDTDELWIEGFVSNAYSFSNFRIDPGTYTFSSNVGVAKTFFEGDIFGDCAVYCIFKGTYFVQRYPRPRMPDWTMINGGTVTVELSGNTYTVTTNLRGKIYGSTTLVNNINYKYTGIPQKINSY